MLEWLTAFEDFFEKKNQSPALYLKTVVFCITNFHQFSVNDRCAGT